MMTGYQSLGLDDLSRDARRVLEKNFPSSVYLSKGYDPKVRSGNDDTKPSLLSRFKFWN